jgi:hypothetical protein
MVYLLVRQKVRDLEKWKAAFDAHSDLRSAKRIHTRFLFQNVDVPDEVVLMFEAQELSILREFTVSPEFVRLTLEAEITGKPDMAFLQ